MCQLIRPSLFCVFSDIFPTSTAIRTSRLTMTKPEWSRKSIRIAWNQVTKKNHAILWKRERVCLYTDFTRIWYSVVMLEINCAARPACVKPLHKDQYLFSTNIQNKSLFTGCLLSCLEDLHWQQSGALGGLHEEGDQWGKGLRSTDLLLLWVD